MARTLVIDQLRLHKLSITLDTAPPGSPAGVTIVPHVFAEYALLANGRRVQMEHGEFAARLSATRRQQIAQLVADMTADLSAIEQL